MKKIAVLAIVVIGLMIASCGPSQKEAMKYNDEMVNIQRALSPLHETFIDQVDGHNVDSMKLAYSSFTEKAKASLEACEKLGPFAEKREYLDAAIEYFKVL